MQNSKFSVLMSVYRNDKPDDVRTAVESITVRQSVKPDEVVLMIDGPVPTELKETVMELAAEIPSLIPHFLKENGGLGNALNIGMTKTSYDLVARMDADDISLPDRFEKQIRFMTNNPDIAVCGGQISEFIGSPENIVGYRLQNPSKRAGAENRPQPRRGRSRGVPRPQPQYVNKTGLIGGNYW